jgi:hypothetical protein
MSETNLRVRGEWIAASQFHDLTEDEVLREVARRVSNLKSSLGPSAAKHAHPLVLLDLDSTLYEVGPRTHQILREWLESPESAEFSHVRTVLRRLEAEHIGYSLVDTFEAVGLEVEEHEEVRRAERSAKKFWGARFFTSEYLAYDEVYPGAAAFARELHKLGAELVYLTGRDEPGMGEGTRNRLIKDGFPFNTPGTHLLCKKSFELDDLEHKQAASTYIRAHGTLIASFENEPPNVVALYEIFPEAMHVFVDTVCSDRPSLPRGDLYRIKGFGSFAEL